MNSDTFLELVQNAALLLALAVLYDLLPLQKNGRHPAAQILSGVLIGLIGMGVMLSPWHFSGGVIFDTRSILLSLSGFFFGLVPSVIAFLMTSALRLVQGGNGAPTGIGVLLTSAGLGLAWRYIFRAKQKTPRWYELYLFGVIVHIVMLLWMLTLPQQIASNVLQQVSLPVLLIYPVVTVLMGLLLTGQAQRNQAEEGLRLAETKYRNLVEQIPAATYIDAVDRTSSTLYFSPQIEAMTGYSPEEWVGDPELWVRLVHPADLENLLAENARTNMTGDPFRMEYRLVARDGQTVWVRDEAVLIRSADGHPQFWQGILLDITEGKRAEQSLQESEERFRSLFENATIGLYRTTPDGRILMANPTLVRMLGYSSFEELAKRNLEEEGFEPSYTRSQFRQRIDQEGDLRGIESAWRRQDGTVLFIRESSKAMRAANGSVLYYEGTVEDITERQRSEEALRELTARQETLLAAIPDIVMEVDQDKVYQWANATGLEFFGPDVIGRKAAYYFEGEQDTYKLVKPIFNGDGSTLYVESWQRRKDGEKRLLGWWCRTIKDPQGRVIGALSSARDITEIVQAQEEIRSLNADLEQRVERRTLELRTAQEKLVRQERLAVLGQLAGGVGHELRNPLGVINNSIYYLRLVQPEAGGKIKEHLGIIEQEVRKAVKIISDLLDYARVISVEREQVGIARLVNQTLEHFPIPASVEVVLEMPDDLPEVYADPGQVGQVLGNLITNACQAMKSGGKITISATRQEGMAAIAVEDTGVGITPENMKRLFEPLFTTKARGIGLGLAVSRKLAEANGGRIEVQSEAGQGSTFTLFLPVQEDQR
jgi:PAS domain S-box-containing protein